MTIHHHLERNSGAPGTTLALADAYRRAGHDAEVFSLEDLPQHLPVRTQMVLFPWFVAARVGPGCDVVDASSGDAWLWSIVRRKSRPLLVTRSHGLEHTGHLQRLADHRDGHIHLRRRYFLYHGGERLWEVAVSLRRADLVLFLNRTDLDYAIERLGVERRVAHIVHNGIDHHLIGLPPPSPQSGGVAIAVIGRHTREKGAPYLVAAMNRILSDHEEVSATLLGTHAPTDLVLADFDPSVRARVNVVPTYARADLRRLLQAHEIALSATLVEGFGLALLEAMACGLAPIATETPGPREFVRDETNGLLVPARDADALVQAVERLILDPKFRLQLRRNAHATAQCYSWDATAAKRLRLYEQARVA